MAEKVVIGNAELWHGDCREVLPLLGHFDAVVTDPPYGIGWDASHKKGCASSVATAGGVYGKNWGLIVGDDAPFNPAHLLALGKPAVLWGANHYSDKLPTRSGWLVWDKKRGGSAGKGYVGSDAELAWSSATPGRVQLFQHYWEGFRRDSEVGYHVHPTQKPVALMQWVLDKAGRPAVVCDPYMGAGATGVAAMNLGLRFVGVEIHRPYFDEACRRIEDAQRQAPLIPLDSTQVAVQQVMEL